MNKLAFRVIFNRHRGLLMAVAETARACGAGRASAGRNRPHPAWSGSRRLLPWASPLLACLYLAFPPALAQIVWTDNSVDVPAGIEKRGHGQVLSEVWNTTLL